MYVDPSGESYTDCIECQHNSGWKASGDLKNVPPGAFAKIEKDISKFFNNLKVGNFLGNNLFR